MVLVLGFYINCRKLGYSIFGVMLFVYLVGVFINVGQEMGGNLCISEMGIVQDYGVMEGKEVWFGVGVIVLWSVIIMVIFNGLVNGMYDLIMLFSGMVEMLNMQINIWFGGVGVGWLNYYIFIIMVVFISGLMVGCMLEFLGKKVEVWEMKIVIFVVLLYLFVILVFIVILSYVYIYYFDFVESEGGWLNNFGFYGFSEQFYEYILLVVNNGLGFEGLGDNIYFWNWICGIVFILSWFILIVGQVVIVGLLV